MKKYLIVLAAAVVALASCTTGEKYTSIRFKETQIVLAQGATDKLQVLYEPTSIAEAPQCVWASSDTNVVFVDQKGNIEAREVGDANVTATYGEGENALKAVCKVTVNVYEAMWAPSSTVYYFPSTKSEKPLSDTVFVYEGSKASYSCQLYSVELCIPSDIDIPGDDPGVGDFIFVKAAIPFIISSTSGEYIGDPFDLAFFITPEEAYDTTEYGAIAGSLDPEVIGPVWQAYLEAHGAGEQADFDKEAYELGLKGAYLKGAMVDGGSIASYPWVDAIITDGGFYTQYNAETEELSAVYKLQVDWCGGFMGTGLAMNEEAETWDEVLAQPYTLELSRYTYRPGEYGQPQVVAAPRKVVRKNNISLNQFKPVPYQKLQLVKYLEANKK